jgi:hypothetical protein
VYEYLGQLAELKFSKKREDIAAKTRAAVRDAEGEFAAKSLGAGRMSGPHEASLARIRMTGSEEMVQSYLDIWVGLIRSENNRLVQSDVDFIVGKIEVITNAQTRHMINALQQRPNAATNMLIEESRMKMQGAAASARRDLVIMVREDELAYKKKLEADMKFSPKKRFSIGSRVMVGIGMKPATVTFVDDQPSVLAEFKHSVRYDSGEERDVLGCDMQRLPALDEDLPKQNQQIYNLSLQNANVGNLNLGTQFGTINAMLQVAAQQGPTQKEFAEALKLLTESVVSSNELKDQEKHEVVEVLSTIAEESVKKPEERSTGTLKALVNWIPIGIGAANGLVTLWGHVGPIILKFLGM